MPTVRDDIASKLAESTSASTAKVGPAFVLDRDEVPVEPFMPVSIVDGQCPNATMPEDGNAAMDPSGIVEQLGACVDATTGDINMECIQGVLATLDPATIGKLAQCAGAGSIADMQACVEEQLGDGADESELMDMPTDCQPQQEAFVACFSTSQEPACEGIEPTNIPIFAGKLKQPEKKVESCEEVNERLCGAMVGCCDKEITDLTVCIAKSMLDLDCNINCGGAGPTSGGNKVTSGLFGLLIAAIGGALVGGTV